MKNSTQKPASKTSTHTTDAKKAAPKKPSTRTRKPSNPVQSSTSKGYTRTMKTKTTPRRYAYSVVSYFGRSMIALNFYSTSLAEAKRHARRLGMGDRQVMTAREAQKILNAYR